MLLLTAWETDGQRELNEEELHARFPPHCTSWQSHANVDLY